MSWSRVYEVLKAIAALSGLVAFVTLAITLYKDHTLRAKNYEIQLNQENILWSEAAVYDLLYKSGLSGLPFEKLLSKYQAEGINGPDSVSKETLREVTLQRVLLSLVRQSAVAFRNDQTYALAMAPRSILSADLLAGKDLELRNKILDFVDKNPDKYSMPELVNVVVDRFSATRGEALIAAGSLGRAFMIASNANGKVSTSFITLPPPILPAPGNQ